MSDKIIEWFYKDTDFKRYKGYRLLSVDGTVLEIENTEDLRKEFGYIENQSIKVVQSGTISIFSLEDLKQINGFMHF